MSDHLETFIEPELEVRIVALVLGEASDFEKEELERLMEENPELALFRNRMTLLHGMLEEIGEGESVDDEAEDWKLPTEKRGKLLETLGEKPAAVEDSDVLVPERPAVWNRTWFRGLVASAAALAFLVLPAFFLLSTSENRSAASYGGTSDRLESMLLADSASIEDHSRAVDQDGAEFFFSDSREDVIDQKVRTRRLAQKPRGSEVDNLSVLSVTAGSEIQSPALNEELRESVSDQNIRGLSQSLAGESDETAIRNFRTVSPRVAEEPSAATIDDLISQATTAAPAEDSPMAFGINGVAFPGPSDELEFDFVAPESEEAPAPFPTMPAPGQGVATSPRSAGKGLFGRLFGREPRQGDQPEETPPKSHRLDETMEMDLDVAANEAFELTDEEVAEVETLGRRNLRLTDRVDRESEGIADKRSSGWMSGNRTIQSNAKADDQTGEVEAESLAVTEPVRDGLVNKPDEGNSHSLFKRADAKKSMEAESAPFAAPAGDVGLRLAGTETGMAEAEVTRRLGDEIAAAREKLERSRELLSSSGEVDTVRRQMAEIRTQIEEQEIEISEKKGVLGIESSEVEKSDDLSRIAAELTKLRKDQNPPQSPTVGYATDYDFQAPGASESESSILKDVQVDNLAENNSEIRTQLEELEALQIELKEIRQITQRVFADASIQSPDQIREMLTALQDELVRTTEKNRELHETILKRESLPREVLATEQPFSTFSLHVGDVSFKLAHASLTKGQWPDAGRIRIEEFINAFDYPDPIPGERDRVSATIEQAIHPLMQQRNLLRISMRTAAEGRNSATPLRLTFLIDSSGSMARFDRRETLRRAFSQLVGQLRESDRVNLISFARKPRLVSEGVPGDRGEELVELVATLPEEGGTNLEAALELAFAKARETFDGRAQNRIILLTDGAANLGDADPERLSRLVESMRNQGIAFDTAGVGAEGLNDEILEALSRKGDGRYYLLDSPEDADDEFARKIAGALRPAAKNVKVQVEFNPRRVGKYQLHGFEKHRLKKEDFRNDKVDAAEMAAAEAGVATYQFEPLPDGEGDVGSVSVRFLDMATGQMVEKRWPIPWQPTLPRLEESPEALRLASIGTFTASKLKGDPLGDLVEWSDLAEMTGSLSPPTQKQPAVTQLNEMISRARAIAGQ